MKKAWALIVLFVFAVGFFMGRAFPGPKEVSEIPESLQVAAYAAPTPRPASAPAPRSTTAEDELIVYLSRNSFIHRESNCSGMKHYKEMTLTQAQYYGYRKCSKCW